MKDPSLFDQPITWGDYIEFRISGIVLAILGTVIIGLIVAWEQSTRCPSCRRDARQWSWRAVGPYKNRHLWCPYCEKAPGEPNDEN